MKKIIASIVALSLWMSFVNAQDNNQPQKPNRPQFQQQGQLAQRPMIKQKMMQAARQINFTKEQREQLKSINENYHTQLAQLEKNDKITLGEYKSKLAALKKEHKEKTQAILTAEQKNKIAAHKKNAEINAKVNATARLERMKLTLGLNEDQVAKLKTQQKDLQEKMKAIRENETLLPEQKKEQLKALAAQQKESFKSVLTADQQSKLDSMRKNFQPRFKGRNFSK
jgi:hypothetical protein